MAPLVTATPRRISTRYPQPPRLRVSRLMHAKKRFMDIGGDIGAGSERGPLKSWSEWQELSVGFFDIDFP